MAVIDRILERGFDQGWFLRPDLSQLAHPAPDAQRSFLSDCAKREEAKPTIEDPWATTDPPSGDISTDAPGYVILTQRCDLVRSVDREPLVELAAARLVTDADILLQAGSNSPRFVRLTEVVDATAWVVDLRERAWLPKHLLADQDAVQPIKTLKARKRFRLRIGQRYWRDPVPDDLVVRLQRPLKDALSKGAERVRLSGYFSDWIGIRDGERVTVIAIIGAGKDRQEAEDAFDTVMKKLKPDVLATITPESGAVEAEDISHGLWLESFKFDFDEITYGRRADDTHAEPTR